MSENIWYMARLSWEGRMSGCVALCHLLQFLFHISTHTLTSSMHKERSSPTHIQWIQSITLYVWYWTLQVKRFTRFIMVNTHGQAVACLYIFFLACVGPSSDISFTCFIVDYIVSFSHASANSNSEWPCCSDRFIYSHIFIGIWGFQRIHAISV